MGGRKTAGVIFSEAFELIKKEYKVLWVISLIMFGISIALGIVMSVFMLPFQIFATMIGPMIDGMSRNGMESAGYWIQSLVPMIGVFSALYLVVVAVSIVASIAEQSMMIGGNYATLQLLDGTKPRFEAVWQNFIRNWKRYLGITAWTMLWTFLWSLLFIVPGIIKGYNYRLAPYLMIEYPDMTIREALRKSMEITQGYKGRMFLLDLIVAAFSIASIIGICVVVIGYYAILLLWVMPLMYAMFAIVYRDIKMAAQEKGLLPVNKETTY